LPEGFEGHDYVAIAKEVDRRLTSVDKNEFETEAAFEARRKDTMSGRLLGDLTTDSVFGFILDDDLRNQWFLRYDADREVFRINASDLLSKEGETVWVSTERYEHENEYALDTKKVYSQSELHLSVTPKWARGVFQLPMPPEAAKDAKDQIRLMLIGHLAPPWNGFESTERKSTLLTRHITYKTLLFFEASEVWVVRMDTREILLRFTP